jgi:hypothetical protein
MLPTQNAFILRQQTADEASYAPYSMLMFIISLKVLEIADMFVPGMILLTFSAPSTHCPSARSTLIIADRNLMVL